ncbi:hypothetical protein ABTK69_19180, partial [Acinetobacter baumannii]
YGITWPTLLKVVAVDDLMTLVDGVCTALTVTLAVGDVTTPSVAEAVFVIEPVSTSACVVAYDAVQVMWAPGARPPEGNAGHATLASLLSETEIGELAGIVTLPR